MGVRNSNGGSVLKNIIAQMLRAIESMGLHSHFIPNPQLVTGKSFWLEQHAIKELLTEDQGIQFWSCISRTDLASQQRTVCGLHLSVKTPEQSAL